MRFVLCAAACAALVACGGSQSSRSFQADVAEDTISLSDIDLDVTFERDTSRDPEAIFALASDTPEDGPARYLAASTSDATRAAILISHGDTASTADVFFDQIIAPTAPTTGRGTFEGAYFGTFTFQEQNNLMARIDGTAKFAVNFDTLSISGFIRDRTSPLFGVEDQDQVPLLFDLSTSLLLETADIDENGAFNGNVTVIDLPRGEGGNGAIVADQGRYSGTFGGSNAEEIVGAVRLTSRDENDDIIPETGEVGVFRAIRTPDTP